ncbi:unnamed protein product [Rotaria sp. Silwood1]|nr:unnamed protein product [Rotaria sp. Silwood1]CAF1603731.1 unnamed protein product [Rotaria sp. Silwood1]CAF3748255.1 unnamed protein product [Rotaria sp. Silwood1]CAF4902181.1 unnamed protein product [Rotaria sp. Silwood1]
MGHYITLFGIFLLVISSWTAAHLSKRSSPSVLYVWSGQERSVPNASDFVAVIDFDGRSPTYGHILKTVSLVSDVANGIGQVGNEPHHSAISTNGRYYMTGGLLSFLSGNKEVFVWKIPKNPTKGPEFLYALDVPGACTDEFLPIGGSEFLLSMMCNEQAVSPGNIVYINAETRMTKSILKNISAFVDFNPHGFGRLANGSIFVGDYIEPITLVGSNSSQILFRNTARHILPDGTLERIFQFQFPTTPGSSNGIGYGIGFMELKAIPGDPFGRSYACGTSVNNIYLIGPGMPEPILAIDLSQVNGYQKRASAGLLSFFSNGQRVLMTFQLRYVILANITRPEQPNILRVFDFCTDPTLKHVTIGIPDSFEKTTFAKFCAQNNNITGSHAIIQPKDENRFVVVNYFLKFGLAQFSGTRTVHAFKLNKDLTDFEYDHKFNPNFQLGHSPKKQRLTFHSLQAYPHHVQYLKLEK